MVPVNLIKFILLLLTIVASSGCGGGGGSDSNSDNAAVTVDSGTGDTDNSTSTHLVFETYLEAETDARPVSAIDLIKISNPDSMVGYSSVFYEDGFEADRYARIVPDPVGAPSNNVLHFWLQNAAISNPPWGMKGRVQADIFPDGEITNIVQAHRLFLHPDMALYKTYPDENTWFVIHDFWVGVPWDSPPEPYPFLIGLNIVKPVGIGTDLYFSVSGRGYNYTDGAWNESAWAETNLTFPVPIGEWLDVRIVYIQGNDKNGRYGFAVKKANDADYVTVFDITNWTYNPKSPTPVPIFQISGMKAYTSDKLLQHFANNSGAVQIYWDDIKMTTELPL